MTSIVLKSRHTAMQNTLIIMIILSGVLKMFFYSSGLFINISLITSILVFCDITYTLFNKKIRANLNQRIILFIISIFYGWLLISSFYSPSQSYKFIKSINFSLCMLFFCYPLVVKKINAPKIMSLLKFCLISLSLFYIYKRAVFWAIESTELRALGLESFGHSSVYLPLGILLGLVAVYESYKKKWKWVWINLALILAIGSRGAFIFSIITIFGFMPFFKSTKDIEQTKKPGLVYLLIVAIICYMCVSNLSVILDFSEMGLSRFESLISGADRSSLSRFDQYDFAINMITKSGLTILFGYGIGSFGLLYEGIDERSYPHNVLLEVWFELGLIGLILFCLIVFLGYHSTKKSLIKFILFYLVLNLMKSNSLVDAWIFFLFLGIATFSKKIIDYDPCA